MTATVSIGLVLTAACSGDDAGPSRESSPPATSGTGAPLAATDETARPTAGSGQPPTSVVDETAPPTGVETDEGEPIRGGTLVYGIEADTSNAWPPYRASVTAPGFLVLSAVTDPLFLPNDAGEPVPHLVESAEANDDHTQWRFTLRDGITFHDGSPFDAAAVKVNVDACRGGTLSRGSYSPITSVQAEGQVVTLTTEQPWVPLPSWFATANSCSYMLSGEWLTSLPDLPQRDPESPVYDEEIAALPAGGDPARPVGLGAFRFESYTPGNGNSFTAVRNDDYWRGDGPSSTGEGLPYLDGVELVVATDIVSRSNTLRSGGFDIMHTANADEIAYFLDDGGFETHVSDTFGESYSIMLNHAAGDLDPEGTNAANPLLHRSCRRALAMAIDYDRLNEERNAGLAAAANGPFPPGSIGYLEDTGYPAYDPDGAQREFEQCLVDAGTPTVEVRFATWNDPFNVETNELVISMWNQSFGDRLEATVEALDVGQYVGLAFVGDYDMLAWRGHGGSDPDQQRRWWHSSTAQPLGTVGTNYARLVDPVIDESFDIMRTDPDPAARRAAAEAVNRRFGEEVYELWLFWVLWGVISQPYVNGVEVNRFVDGGSGPGLALTGRHQMPQLWCDEGSCE